MNKILYKQYDSRWGKKPYPTSKSTFSGNGCGCVACTHLIIEQEKYKNLTPEPVRKWMVSQGYAVSGQGTTWAGIPATLKHYGYKTVVHIGENDPMSKAWKELDKGNRIGIILFVDGKAPNGIVWTRSGHYVAFTDYKVKNGKHLFYTKDSGPRCHDSKKNGYYSYENSMKGTIHQMWIVERIDSKPKKTKTKVTAKVMSTSKAAAPSKLSVDGDFGPTSIKAWQKVLGTTQDGYISGQLIGAKKYHVALRSVEYGSGGSTTIKTWQKKLKLSNPDGQLGPNTIKATQKALGLSNPDGYFGPNTAKALQKWINNPTELKIEEKKTSTKKTSTTKKATTTKKTSTSTVKKTSTAKKTSTSTAKKTFAKTLTAKGKAKLIIKTAKELRGSAKKPTPAFKKALKKAFPNRKSWGAAARVGKSCDVCMAVVLRTTGLDKGVPRGLKEQYTYKPNSKNFKRLVYKNVRPYDVSKYGDAIIYKKSKGKNAKGHACIRSKNGIYQGNHPKKYLHYTKGFSKLKTKRPVVYIWRPI